MPHEVKIIFTVFIVLVGIGILLVNPKENNAGPNCLWRQRKKDLMLSILFRKDGAFRRFTKLGSLLFFLLFLATIWFAIPAAR